MNIFADRIKKLRLEKNLTLAELGRMLGMSRQNLSFIEQGYNMPSLKTVLMFGDYYNVSLDYLLGRTDIKYMDEKHYTSKIKGLYHELETLKVRVEENNLGKNIRVKRAEKGLTISELSDICGVTRRTIGHIERGTRKPHKKTYEKILKALQEI
ncbi:hypothetical protein K144312032_12440 [Clostridium tetani]|uniref:helix-turn-helix domain-containing protein n=1 Tax=Clostridium tetani TaxID=1513 RepID=UPI002952EB07|nr:helix-turn-helix transcriptional regulator [Clostridium tetani]BDR67016.1 hypothetical protein K144312032_12440 [Clostridium tetani]